MNNNDTMTAEERGKDLFALPMSKLPPLAMEFLKDLCKRVGMCGEVIYTGLVVYAQCAENLPCTDSLYLASPSDIEWFKERLNSTPKQETK